MVGTGHLMAAAYLANKPAGAALAYLIAAAVIFAVALVWAGWAKDLYRALMAAGVGLVVLAFLF